MDEPSEEDAIREFFQEHGCRRRLVLIGECELDESNCWDMLLTYGTVEDIQLTSDRLAAFVDFECEHTPLLVARCFAFSRSNPLVPFPNGVVTLLPGCSFDKFVMLHNVPRDLSTNALHLYFAQWCEQEVKVYRPGPIDRPSARAVVALPMSAEEFLSEGLRVMVPVNGRVHKCFAIPELAVLTNVSGVLTMRGCEACNTMELRSTMLNEQRKQERDAMVLDARDMDEERSEHAEDEGYVSPDVSQMLDEDPQPVVPGRRPKSLEIPEERVSAPSPSRFDPTIPEFVPAHRPLARVIPEQRVPLVVANEAPEELPSLLDVNAPEPLFAIAAENKRPEVQRNDNLVFWRPVAQPPPPSYSTPYVARPMLPRPIPKEEKWDDVPSVTEELKVVETKVKDPSFRSSDNVFLTPTLPRLDAGEESAFPKELFPKHRPPLTPKDKKKKKKKRKGSEELPEAHTSSTSANEPNNDGIPEPSVNPTRGDDKSMEYSNQARSSPIPLHSLSIVDQSTFSFHSFYGLEAGKIEPCNELSTIRPEEYRNQESWALPTLCPLPINRRWDEMPAFALPSLKNNAGQGKYDNRDHTTVIDFGFAIGESSRPASEEPQTEENKDESNGMILSSAPFAIVNEQVEEEKKKEVEQRDRSYSIVSTASCQSRTASETGAGGEEEEGEDRDDVASLLSSTCLSGSASEVESEDEERREMEEGVENKEEGKEEDGAEVLQRAPADFPTANAFNVNENTKEMEGEEHRDAVDFSTVNDVFDASENTTEKEEEEQRDLPLAALCTTSLSMMMSRVGSGDGKEDEKDGGEDAVDGGQRDSELACLEDEKEVTKEKDGSDGESAICEEERKEEGTAEEEQRDSEHTCLEEKEVEEVTKEEEDVDGESTMDKEERKERETAEEEQRDSEHTCLEFSDDEESRKDSERDSDDLLSGEEDKKQWSGGPQPIAAPLPQVPTVKALSDAVKTKEEEGNQYHAYEPPADDISEEEMVLLAEAKELLEFEEIEAKAYEFVAALPAIVEESGEEEDEEGKEETGGDLQEQENEEQDEVEVADAVGDIVDQSSEENSDSVVSPVASPTVLVHTDTETSREASEISDDETIGLESNRSEESTLSDASSDTLVTEEGYIVHPDEWDEADQIQYGIRKHTILCTIDEEEEEEQEELQEEVKEKEQKVVEEKEDDPNSAVSVPASSIPTEIEADDSEEEYRSESEYHDWLTRLDKRTVKEVSRQPSLSSSDSDIVPLHSNLPVYNWGKGIVIDEKPTVNAQEDTMNGPQPEESPTVRETAPSVRGPSFLSKIRALQAAKNNSISK